jgi:hypothetical protein
MGVGVGVGVGFGGGETGGTAGGGAAFCGGVRLFPVSSLPVLVFCTFRRGGGELRGCASELPSLLKKSPMGLAAVECPPRKNAATDKIKTLLPSR